HILGQAHSTFSMREAMDSGTIILVDLNKGLLGKHSATLGSLLMAQINSAVFARKSRSIYSLYLDEIQNLLTADSDVDVLLAEARKFGISVVSANQYLDQFPKNIRSAIQAVGTHIAFQLSSDDATAQANMLGGGKPLSELLKISRNDISLPRAVNTPGNRLQLLSSSFRKPSSAICWSVPENNMPDCALKWSKKFRRDVPNKPKP
ncbi:MAG TPA: hypothetical protein VN223_12230, partial [Candidatus Elarobacter sp.]|nr:hypothetical protein [Candidatus Elarobacter sp.]